jgi:large subunit ribosomal protein L18
MPQIDKKGIRIRIHKRIRNKIAGTPEVIDDVSGRTLAAASSNEKGAEFDGGNVAGAKEVGRMVAARAREKGISRVVFDRGGYQYHGRVKALADAAREGGLEF